MDNCMDFHIHGDNIVECERTFELITAAFGDRIVSINGPRASAVCPEFLLYLQGISGPFARLTFYPGFGRWNEDILGHVRERGGILRETPDSIITRVDAGAEEPLVAIEYCGALPAGNQAWQRSGRAYSFGLAGIPYLYVAELGGYELDAERGRKAPRMPNPAVPFSYLSYSLQRDTAVLPIFVVSPGADEVSRKAHEGEFADAELLTMVRSILLNEDTRPTREAIERKVLSLVKRRAGACRGGRTLAPEQWEALYLHIREGGTLTDYLVERAPLPWSKIAYIEALTDTARRLMQLAAASAVGLTSTALPMCIVPARRRANFAAAVASLYRDLPGDFTRWLTRNGHLAVCWVMGFKPRGDDARPDRGLAPLTRMLIGHGHDLLTVVYGPAPSTTWPLLRDAPAALAKRNGLWEAILSVSDGILVDSATDHVTRHGFIRAHWETEVRRAPARPRLVQPAPLHIGENDVDTVLHMLLARHGAGQVYEGMCNPPGGDWSGISFQSPDRSVELRWLSLPRVTAAGSKRPDHVFELFGVASNPIILAVESKETSSALENRIGPRLRAYVAHLIESPASIERANPSHPWRHSSYRLNPTSFLFASAVAFIGRTEAEIQSVMRKAQADVILAYEFASHGRTCTIRCIPQTKTGILICDFVRRLDLSETGTSIELG